LIEAFYLDSSAVPVPVAREEETATTTPPLHSGSAAATSLLVLQCDPLSSSHALIRYAAYLCTSICARYRQHAPPAVHATLPSSSSSGVSLHNGVSSLRKHIVIVVHMPPGAKNSLREYEVSFYPGWTYVFVDDIRTGILDLTTI
jgi:hypothetical protein